MTVITEHEIAEWYRRLTTTAAPTVDDDVSAVPEWFLSAIVHVRGRAGLELVAGSGPVTAPNPDAYEGALVRAHVGDLTVFSSLMTSHTSTMALAVHGGDEIVMIGTVGKGTQFLRAGGSVATVPVGRTGFLSNLVASVGEQVELSQVTALVLPVSLVASYRSVIERGAQLLPDTAITKVAADAWCRLLVEFLRAPEPSLQARLSAESILLTVTRALLQQAMDDDVRKQRAVHARAAAATVIERRHSDPTFGVDELAADLHLSRRQLYRYFDGETVGVSKLLQRRRLEAAKELLFVEPPHDLDAIARWSGFLSAATLRAQFTRTFGVSPTEYRRGHRISEATAPGLFLRGEAH